MQPSVSSEGYMVTQGGGPSVQATMTQMHSARKRISPIPKRIAPRSEAGFSSGLGAWCLVLMAVLLLSVSRTVVRLPSGSASPSRYLTKSLCFLSCCPASELDH
jgi:hypothetical protein